MRAPQFESSVELMKTDRPTSCVFIHNIEQIFDRLTDGPQSESAVELITTTLTDVMCITIYSTGDAK